MPVARVRDLDVYYEIRGSGPPVLSISGSGGNLRVNPDRAPSLLEQHFTVLAYDQRGLGQTSKPDVPYTMADYADDAAALLDVVGWPSAHVVGLSFGGMVAQHLAIRHPDRVQRLVMGCTSPGGVGGSSYDLRLHEGLDPVERGKVSLGILDSRSDFSVDPPRLAPGVDTIMRSFAAGSRAATDPEAAAGFRRQLDARAEHDATAGLASITSPTLVVAGRYDLQAPLVNSEYLAAHIPGARLYVAEGGHLFMMQDPTAWPVMVAFLESSS